VRGAPGSVLGCAAAAGLPEDYREVIALSRIARLSRAMAMLAEALRRLDRQAWRQHGWQAQRGASRSCNERRAGRSASAGDVDQV